mmetsp:Transcript_13771/g.37286  ORF Transcript_13771/g.37286 Transcript_13771/m.37286 type:complete len:693 (+) Transcript_13771:139-2217(+)
MRAASPSPPPQQRLFHHHSHPWLQAAVPPQAAQWSPVPAPTIVAVPPVPSALAMAGCGGGSAPSLGWRRSDILAGPAYAPTSVARARSGSACGWGGGSCSDTFSTGPCRTAGASFDGSPTIGNPYSSATAPSTHTVLGTGADFSDNGFGQTTMIPASLSQLQEGALAAQDQQLMSLPIGREVNAVALSPDGRRALFGLQDHTLQMWDLEAQVLLNIFKGHKYWVTHVAYSVDGIHIASASADKSIKVWNAANGKCEATLQGHMLSVAGVAFADDATRLASGSWDKTVCIWDVERAGRALLTLIGHTDWVHSVAWAPGGRRLASASSDHSVRVWNVISGVVEQVLVGHLQTVSSVSFARNGVFLASGSLDRTVRVWNVQDGTLSARLQQDTDEGSVHCVDFAPDSERIVVGCSDKAVKVWNFRTGDQEGQLLGHEDAVFGVSLTPDGNHIVSCSHDKTARVWHMPSKRSAATALPATPAGGTLAMGQSVAGSFQELHDRLRTTEDTNQRLRQQLSEAQSQIEEKNRRMKNRESNLGEQERQLSSYREMISSLTFEKEKLERSFEEMRKELRQLPSSPAGRGASASNSGVLAAMTLGPAGGRRGLGTDRGSFGAPTPMGDGAAPSRQAAGLLHISRPAGGSPGRLGSPSLSEATSPMPRPPIVVPYTAASPGGAYNVHPSGPPFAQGPPWVGVL